jgi:two-component system response regulator AtoC
VRELRNVLERALVLEAGEALSLGWLSPGPDAAPGEAAFVSREVESLDALERRYARWALEQHQGRRLETAKALGVSHPTFNKLVKGD